MALKGLDPRAAFNPYEIVIRLREEPPRYGPVEGADEVFGIASLDAILRPYKPVEIHYSPRRQPRGWIFTIVFSTPVDIPQLVKILKRNVFVEDASPQYIYHLTGAS